MISLKEILLALLASSWLNAHIAEIFLTKCSINMFLTKLNTDLFYEDLLQLNAHLANLDKVLSNSPSL
jgi:hypothetical protein